MDESTMSIAPLEEEVRPYKIHVSALKCLPRSSLPDEISAAGAGVVIDFAVSVRTETHNYRSRRNIST